MLGNGYGYLGKMAFKLVRSTHIRHLFDDFNTKTALASQVILNLCYKTNASQLLDPFINVYSLLLSHLMCSLRDWLHYGINGKAMTYHFGIYLWHVRGPPGEQVYVPSQ